MKSASEILTDLHRLGVHAWADGGDVRFRAPKGRLTPVLIDQIKSRKVEILQLLQSMVAAPGPSGHIPSVPRDGDLPLSSAQRRLWFLDQYSAGGSTYSIPISLRLTGDLRIGVLAASIGRIVERHETLRTVFGVRDGTPFQRVLSAAAVEIPVEDCSPQPDALLRAIEEEMLRPFDLATGPLFRVKLFRLGTDDHLLSLVVHHIVSDAWSVGVFVQEFSELYDAACSDRVPALPALGVQYADFAVWQHERLRSGVYDEQLEYWRRQLRGAPPLLELPGDRPRPPVQTQKGRTETFELGSALTARLKAFSQLQGCSLYMVLLAGFSALLARHSGQDEVLIGSPVANRNNPQLEKLIGFFVNTIALRVDVRDDPSFETLVARTKQTALDAFAHQDIPFEDLVEDLQPERSLGHQPIYQVMFALQNAPISTLTLPGVAVSVQDFTGDTAKFDLTLTMAEAAGRLAGAFEYSTDLFDQATIRRMIGHFEILLAASLDAPGTPVSELQLLSPEETELVLRGWTGGTAAFPGDRCIHEVFEARVVENPDRVALVFEGQSVTYGDLNARANRLAHHLIALGVRPDTLVAVALERGIELVVALLATLKAGGAYVPLDPAYPEERLAFMIADSAPHVLVTRRDVRSSLGALPDALAAVLLDDGDPPWADLPVTNPAATALGLTPSHLAYVIYTSGSTGMPNGVTVEHAQIGRLFASTASLFRFTADDVWTLFHSYAFDFSVWELWGALIHGGRLVVVPRSVARSPGEFDDLLCAEGVTILNLTPSAFRQLVTVQGERPAGRHRLRSVIFGGEALDSAGLTLWYRRNDAKKTTLVNMYGITETTVHVTYCPLRPEDAGPLQGSPIGRPLADLRLYILDRHRAPTPIGVTGELYVGGAGVARGYLNRADLTAERFLADPFVSGARLYRSGDLGRWRPDGTIEYLGRNDHQVKIRGFRIELGEIEAQLLDYPGIDAALVLAREDRPGEKRLVAYFTATAEIATAWLRMHLAQTLPDYMVPAAYLRLDRFPLTQNGKLDRRALPAPGATVAAEESYAPPEGPVEAALAAIWAELLQIDRVGRHDNFFEHGGHSLMAVQMVSRIRDRCGRDVPVRRIFEAPTIAGLAADLDRAALDQPPSARLPPIARCELAGPLPLSYAQERLWFLDQLEPGNAFYNIPMAFRCRGRLDAAVLERAVNEVVRRHASLRTIFREVDGKPFQEIHELGPIGLAHQPLTGFDADQREEAVRQRALAEALTPFHLDLGPLVRATLIALAPDDHVLLLTLHHIIADGWSMGVLVREFSVLYRAFIRGEPSPLPDLAIQFADFAVWQRARLDGAKLEAEIEYWVRQLQGVPHVLELPTDFPRPAIQTFRGAARPFHLAPATVQRLKSLGQSADASLFMVLFAAFAVLLGRYTGEEEFLVGSPIANRDQDAIEALIGFFVNTLALRADLSGDPLFPDLVRRVRETTLGAYAHPNVPFDFVVERVQPVRDMRRNPLVQVSFVFQNTPSAGLAIEDLELRQMPAETGTARFDLEVFLWEDEDGLQGEFAYCTDLFQPDTIGRLAGHFATLLQGIAEEPSCRVSALRLLTDDERRRLLVDWNATAADFSQATTIHALFEEQAARHPTDIAVAHDGRCLTYAALDRRANQLARHLTMLGAGPGRLVGICLERSLDLVVGILAVLKAGAAYVPLDPRYPRARLGFMIEDSGLAILLTHSGLQALLPDHAARPVCLDTGWDAIAEQPDAPMEATGRPEDLAYVIYTSGSTGRPKGTLLEHRNVVNYLCWAREAYAVAAGDGAPVNSSISFDATVTSLIAPLVSGRRVDLLPEQDEIEHLCAALQSDRAYSLVKITPAHLDMLSRMLPRDPFAGGARALIIGGEALTADHIAYWREFAPAVRLINEYGPTETVVGCCVYDVPPSGTFSGDIPIGRPIANTQLYVLDAHRQPVPVGVSGELYIGGAGVGRGYLNRPDLTAERFIPDPFSRRPDALLYKTGDRARYRADGNLEFHGRLDSQVKLRGYRIEIGEIERVLEEHPAVDQAMVLLRRDQPGDARLVAYVVPAEIATETTPADKDEQVTQWQHVFQDSYTGAQTAIGSEFDIAGWNSSYTGTPIPADEMREWVDCTVERIGSLGPRRIWEIGCGTGLLLSRLAPRVASYLGTDFSAAALNRLQRMIDLNGSFANVGLLHRAADDAAGIAGPFDTIILNSVIQYFPSVDYLLGVLDEAVRHLAPGGRIFIGDVRSLPSLELFHSSVELHRAADASPVSELRQRVRERIAREEELLLDRRFFFQLKSRYPGLTEVETSLKRGHHRNEMLRFRYDATLHFGAAAREPIEVPWLDWAGEELSLSRAQEVLSRMAPPVFAVRSVPDARLSDASAALGELRSATAAATARQVRQRLGRLPVNAVDPEDFWTLGAALGYRVDIAVSDAPACFDAIFQRPDAEGPLAFGDVPEQPRPWRHYASDPLRVLRHQGLAQAIRAQAEASLPGYMVPSAYVMLATFPLTANGKIDRAALPAPSDRPAAETIVAPRTQEEEVLAAIWAGVLGLDHVGIHDDFFALGGHSLLATQVISRVRDAFGVELQVRAVFEAPTIADLANRILELRATARDMPAGPPLAPQPRGERVPLSFAQERLWLLDRLEQRSPAYHIASTIRLTGPLDPRGVEHGFQRLIARHEALRTSFASTPDGEPFQRIAAAMDFHLPVIDTEMLSEAARRERIEAVSAEVHHQGFDLERGPLLRAVLIRCHDREHVLLVCMHHIISDGWSVGVLNRELVEFYSAFVAGRDPRLDPLAVQYADYAIWQRRWLTGDALRSLVGHWKARLAGAPPVLELPTDFPRPAVQSFRGRMEHFELDQPLTEALEAFSRRHGASLYMTLLAAFAVLLSRYSRQTDLVIGSPIAGRRNHEIESLLGFFVNTLALRIDLEGDPGFAELLARVRKSTLDAYEHQDVPFEYLVEELRPERSLSHAPVFQVMFILLNMPSPQIRVSDLTLALMESNTDTAKFDLTLCFGPSGPGMWGWFEYCTDLFQPATVRRMVGHLVTLLKGIVAAAALPVGRLPMMSEGECRQLVGMADRTDAVEARFIPVQRRFELQVVATPDRAAVEFGAVALSYRDLNGRANRLARRLAALGIGPRSRVGIALDRGFDMIIGVLAVLKAGGAYVPLDPAYPRERLALMVEDAQLDALVTQESLRASIPESAAPVIVLDGADSVSQDENLDLTPGVDDLAYIIYTSGSTGRPKGIAMRHGALANLIGWQVADASDFGAARTLQFTSLSFDVSFQEIFSTWCSGGTLVLIDEETRRDTRALIRDLAEKRIERLFLPFVALQQLALLAGEQDASALVLRDIITAGERLRITPELSELMRRLPACRLHNHYGPAETHVVTSFTLGPDREAWPDLPPIGRAIANARIYLLDEYRQPVPLGVIGELYIGGQCLARGYWGRPDLTEERFVADPFSGPGGSRLYRTGDLARSTNGVDFEFLGRCDDQAKIRGFRVEPAEVEALLAKSPGVSDVAVIAREDRPGQRRLVAYVVPYPDQPIGESDLRDFVRQALPDYMVPSAFVMMDSLPLSPSGKVNRRALPAPVSDAAADYVPPRTPDEFRMAEIWEAALDRRPIGVKEDFFMLGGHSLLAVRVMARVEAVWGVHLPLAALFQYPTIERLAGRLRQDRAPDRDGCAVPIRPDGALPPFFMVPGAGGNVLYLYDLARRLGHDQPFYGLQAIGLDGRTPPAASVEEMAARYVAEISAIQPDGPCLIGGHSFGGTIAYEICQQLQRSGRAVGLLAVFDTNAPHTIPPPPEAGMDDAACLAEIGAIIGQLSGRDVPISAEALRALAPEAQLSAFRASLVGSGWLPPETTLAQIRGFAAVYQSQMKLKYQLRDPIPTPILLLKAEARPEPGPDAQRLDDLLGPAWGWDALALGTVDIVLVPGNHLTMMTEPNVQATAAALQQRLLRHDRRQR
jgi:amino acid adenylation domain-containing protein